MSRVEFDAGIYHNGALIYDKNIRLGGYGINNPYIITRKVLQKIPNACIAIEADDVLYANFNSQRLWPGSEYVYSDKFIELRRKIVDKVIVEVSSITDMEKYKKLLPDELYIQLSDNE